VKRSDRDPWEPEFPFSLFQSAGIDYPTASVGAVSFSLLSSPEQRALAAWKRPELSRANRRAKWLSASDLRHASSCLPTRTPVAGSPR